VLPDLVSRNRRRKSLLHFGGKIETEASPPEISVIMLRKIYFFPKSIKKGKAS
jgi:hypothetical protein